MELRDYLLAFGLGLLAMGAAAFPLIAAAVVAWWPGARPKLKARFVIACAVVVYGVAGIFMVVSLPFELFGTYLSPQLQYEGHEAVPTAVSWVYGAAVWLLYIIIAVGSVIVPIVARRSFWARLCTGMANKPMHATCETHARDG
ncbi:hypothetical protein HNQ60_001214 [Povalibacter uvarum]|uniref:Uncharacterized protein n=1 Tax=Povalibacter uvarum TaxID=732238 RepID=A0A841HJG9_9GAMM|nr:hypothetical protein [Povalibacter uvarum]MBB6092368.1 hypothetical protein [Povalibacter uvarum]